MHETPLIKKIFQYIDRQEKLSSRKIKKIYVSLSEFGGIKEEHFKNHYRSQASGTRWERVDIEIKRIPYGPELEITRLDFE